MSPRTLVLVRHAKTERAAHGGDHARELLPRGLADAHAAGRWLAEDAGSVPDLVLCSTAARAQQTWAEMATHPWLATVPVRPDRRIYHAAAEGLLEVLREVPAEAEAVVLVGHAPAVPGLVGELVDADRSDLEVVRALADGFPTMACAVLTVDQAWAEVHPGCAVLRTLEVPRG